METTVEKETIAVDGFKLNKSSEDSALTALNVMSFMMIVAAILSALWGAFCLMQSKPNFEGPAPDLIGFALGLVGTLGGLTAYAVLGGLCSIAYSLKMIRRRR
jgi:hypothetical protein